MSELVPASVLTSENPVAVYGTIRIRPDRIGDYHELVTTIIPLVQAEDGCRQYLVHTTDESGEYAFYEHWSSGAALAAHLEQPFMADYFGRMPELLAGGFETRWLTPLA